MDGLNGIWHRPLTELPGDYYLEIRGYLDNEPCWRSFTNALDGVFSFSRLGVAEGDPDRVQSLIGRLGTRAMTIQQFIDYARQAQIGPILRIFNITEPIQIIQQPFPCAWFVTVGESLSIDLRATGFPPPLYQWFKDNVSIPNANGNVLQIPSASPGHSGIYTCEVKNANPGYPIIYSNPVQVTVSPAKPLVIQEHPHSYTVSLNGNAWLTCEVWGGAEDYQWMRNGKEITDTDDNSCGTTVSGSSTNELKIKRIQSVDWAGCYCCRVSRGEDVIFTNDAILRVESMLPPEVHTATDKIALLMGAEDYRSEPKLTAPKYDVQTMAMVFRSLNFKVVSLLNLTKKEMLAAINEFKSLVDEGVYCVFYFCGHGFEASGQCFLLPPDAPLGYNDSHCVSADAILFNVLLQRKPKICCMILDICRLKREGKPELLSPPDGEYVVCYGTSQGHFSYEHNNSGILVSHLKTILQSTLGVEDVFKRLRAELKNDPILNEIDSEGNKVKQAPEIRTTLSEVHRSFHDKINSTGYTQAFTERQRIWERAHRQPGSREITVNFTDFNVIVRLDFQTEFSNALSIFCSVVDAGRSKICKSRITEIPNDLREKAKVYTIQEGTETTLCKNYLPLQDIQRLKAEMLIKLTVTCILHDDSEVTISVVENLGLPLVSRLRLWRESPDLTRRQEAEEVDLEDVDPEAEVYHV